MSTAEVVAAAITALSIVAGAAVAIFAPLISAKRDDARARRQTNDARLDELREVLDKATQALTVACSAGQHANFAISVHEYEDPEPAVQAARDALPDVRMLADRIAVRLTTFHELTDLYSETGAALQDATVLHARFRVDGWTEAMETEAKEAISLAQSKRRDFINRAAASVGPSAPPLWAPLSHGA